MMLLLVTILAPASSRPIALMKRSLCFSFASSTAKGSLSVRVDNEGTLAEAIGDSINIIDSIWVEGPIDSIDFHTLWSACFHGKLVYINLSAAKIRNNRIPNYAFYNPYEQSTPEYWITLPLKEIVLPDDITEIGRSAFSWSELEHINLPKALKKFGTYSFYECRKLSVSPLVIPEGIEEIPGACFAECLSLREVALPSTIKTVGQVAFWNDTLLANVNFPEGLDSIGDGAFLGNHIEHVVLPSTCRHFGYQTFAWATGMKRLTFSEGIRVIPRAIAYFNEELETVDIPSTVEEIDESAFFYCLSLQNANLPEGIRRIDDAAFRFCINIDSLILPPSVEYIGRTTFMDMDSLKTIWTKSEIPPQAEGTGRRNDYSFGGGTSADIPVYVPKGTADLYRNATGWNYFTNFIETDDSPTSIESVTKDDGIKVYSCKDRIIIERQTHSDIMYFVYSINGKLIKQGTANQSSIQITLPHGIYIVKTGQKAYKVAL